MRKLKQIAIMNSFNRVGELSVTEMTGLLGLDENGELWHGALESTEDGRRVVDWTPVNTPKDGAGFTKPQLSFFDKWEQEARERIKADADSSGEAVSLETEKPTHARATSGEGESTPDHDLENGERTDSNIGTRTGPDFEREGG